MPHIDINNTQLYYEDKGNGKETLVFGHSMLFNLRMFDEQVDHLVANYRCISFDFRGHGKSKSPQDGYDLDTLTEDIAQLINKLKCYPCHFIGFSMGGMVALRLAIKYPDLIKSLILIDTSSEPEPKDKMLRNKAMLLVAKHIGLAPLAGKVMSMFFGPEFLKDPNRGVLRETWKNHFKSNDRVGIVKAVKGVIFREGITGELGSISHPATIMVGENDQLTDLIKAEILQNHLKNASLHVIPRAGHMSPVEEPAIVNSILEEHLHHV